MTTTKRKLLTAEDLLELHSKGVKGELIRGVFCEIVSAGIEHGEVAANFSGEIRTFIRPKRLGRVFTSDSGIRLERGPDTVREPDVGFISAERLPLGTRVTGYSEVVPELVIEIVSPSGTVREMYDRACMWLRHGVTLVWVAYPTPARWTSTGRMARQSRFSKMMCWTAPRSCPASPCRCGKSSSRRLAPSGERRPSSIPTDELALRGEFHIAGSAL